jgi:outer membrane protein
MEEYFGVDGSDAASSGLPRYDADGGFKDYGLGISANYKFTNTWGLIAGFNYHRMLGDAEDSPLVDDEGDKNQYKVSVAISYSF